MYNYTTISSRSSTPIITSLLSNATNSSSIEELCIRDPVYQYTLITLFIITVFLSTAENTFMWIAFIINKDLRTHANVYIMSLSLSDIITTCSLAWMEIYYIWEYPYWVFGEIGTMMQNSFWCLSLVTPFVHIIAITVDRYRAVSAVKNYRKKTSLKREVFIVAFLWLYSVGVVALMAFHFSPASDYVYEWNVLPEWYYPFIAVHITVPLFFCAVLYFLILQKAMQSRKEVNSFQQVETKQEFKLARTIFVILVLLFAVWLPVIAMEVVYALHAHTCIVAQIGTVSVWLTCTSGVMNPIVFMWKNKKFRLTILSKVLCFYPIDNSECRPKAAKIKMYSPSPASFHINPTYAADNGDSSIRDSYSNAKSESQSATLE